MMNTSTPRPLPVLANLAAGDLVRSRRRAVDGGVVMGIEYIGYGAVLHNEHFIVTVAWFDGTQTDEDVGTITLLDGSTIVINHTPEARPLSPLFQHAPEEAAPAEVSAPVAAPRTPTRRKAAPARASSTPAPATTAAPAPRKRWSKVQIVAMIKEKEGAVDRGVLCLNKHAALLPEKSRSFVAFWAGWVGSGKTLSGKHLVNARRTCLFNAKVLVDAANGDI